MRAVEVKLLKLRIDTISKGGRNTCCCLLILAWFLASLLFVNLLPSPTASPLSEDCTNLTNGERRGRFCNKHLLNGLSVFETYFMDIDPFSQFLLLTAKPRKAPVSERIKLTKTVQFTTLIEQIGEDFLVTKSLGVLADNEAKVECDFLDSAAEFCSQFTLFLEPQLRPGNYKISFQIYNREDIIDHISQLELEATVINSSYYKILILARIIFFVITIVVLAMYSINIYPIPAQLRVFEQNYVQYLLFSLALFNDPYSAINVLYPSKFTLFLSIILNVSFLAVLLLFWAVMFQVSPSHRREHTQRTTRWPATRCSGGSCST
jgi:hypothetical protein